MAAAKSFDLPDQRPSTQNFICPFVFISMRSVTLILLFLLTAATHAQTRTFTWSDELCEFEGRYDASKYSEAQLRNTTELRRGLSYGISVDATAWKIEDIPKLDVGKLDREYSKNRELLANLDIVNVPYWESVRQGRLKELDQVYRLSRATILGYRTPTSLLEYKDADACIEPFAKPAGIAICHQDIGK